MSRFEFKLPDIGEGVAEGEIVNWLVSEGDSVSENQEMVEVMTDKATVTIGAPKTGKVAERRFKVGDTVPVGDVLVVLDVGGGGDTAAAPAAKAPAAAAAPAKAESGTVASAVGDLRETLPGMSKPAASSNNNDFYSDKPLAAPATRKLARELGVDLKSVQPSGPAGRVTREDVEKASSGGARPAPAVHAPAAAPAAAAAPLPEAARPVRR